MTYNILGVNPGHNGAVALVADGELLYYIEEERLTRMKYDGNPFRGILEVLKKHHVDEIVIVGTTPEQIKLPWTGEDPYTALVRKFNPNVKVTILGHEHHLTHAACAFYNSGFDKAIAIVVDGAGSFKKELLDEESKREIEGFETESIWVCEYPANFSIVFKNYGHNYGFKDGNGNIEFDSAVTITKAYEAVSFYLGFGFIEAGKTMGLAPYGKKDDSIPPLFLGNRASKDIFLPNYPAGAFIDEMRFPQFRRPHAPTEWHTDETKLLDIEKNLAYQIQQDTQRLVGDMIEQAVNATGINKVVLVGGYGLNCVANYYFKKRFPQVEIYNEPISHDGGTCIGAAKLLHHKSTEDTTIRKQESIYYGNEYNKEDLLSILDKFKTQFKTKKTTSNEVAKLISNKNIVALFQGRSEAGPRALGNRSILYDPRDENGKDVVNKVKGREWFRPFAGTILQEHVHNWFDMAGLEESPFMMYACNIVFDKVKEIPAISHVDETCRIQTVKKENNKYYYELINSFYKLTNVPILFNTSFNLAGEPLVETLDDALNTLLNSELKYLYLPELELLVEKQ